MAKTYSGTYTSTILLTNTVQQNPATLTGSIAVAGTNAASDSGFYSSAPFAWSITNLGSISAAGATSYGILLLAGGTINNGAIGNPLGIIRSDETGVLITGAAGQVANQGSILATLGRGVFLQDGGTLTNGAANNTTASILGGFVGVAIYNAGGSLTNAGTIANTGTAGLGVELYAGTVNNLASGHITGNYGIGFVAQSTAGTLVNAGAISGSTRDGVELSGGGSVTNSGSIAGAIAGVLGLNRTVGIVNTGAISGGYAGVDLLAGGSVNNPAGARISGGFGVSFGNGRTAGPIGTVANSGVITGATYEGVSLAAGGGVTNAGSIYGLAAGVAAFYGAGTITNTGAISSGFIGVKLATGGTITNAAGASITGSYGIVLANGPLSGHPAPIPTGLTNAGVITGTDKFGVDLLTNGVLLNQAGGTISGGRYGAYIQSVTGTIANYGVITAQIGVYACQLVAYGTRYASQATIINAGTIIGASGTAVSLFASNALLIDKPGAVFGGRVSGGGGRLELAAGGSGTLGALASDMFSFSTITEDPGASWTFAGQVAAAATLVAQGTLTVVAGTTFINGGTIKSAGSATGTIALTRGSTLMSSSAIQSNVQVWFLNSGGRLSLTNALADAAPNIGFSAGCVIYLPNSATTGLSEVYTAGTGGGALAISQNGTLVANLAFRGTYSTASFKLSADSAGGTDITIPCFLAGTRIAIGPDGEERRVERLRPGTRVLTASGALREIVWVGSRAVDVARHPAPDSVRPVRIRRGAFGPNLPHRDLLLSPDHAVLHGGALIPAHLLINGGGVRWERLAQARYHHIELASHDTVLAEGLAVETYRDTGNRADLGLGGGMPRLPAMPHHAAEPPCAPIALAGRALARARRHLLVQPGATPMKRAGGPMLCVNGALLSPVRQQPRRLSFLLPPSATMATLHNHGGRTLIGAMLDGRALTSPSATSATGCPAAATSLQLPPGNGLPRSLELTLEPGVRGPEPPPVQSLRPAAPPPAQRPSASTRL